MANHTNLQVYQQVEATGMVPVFYHPDPATAIPVVEACYQGGARVFEFTNRGEFAHEVFAEVVKYARKNLPDLILGAGTVYEAGTTALYIQNGADFIVSPVVNPDMAKVCNRRKIPWMPGTATLSEISWAEELGAEIVKIFPGKQVGGPEFVKAALAPSPRTRIMPTGGVEPTRENLEAWFNAGVVCVGMGSKLFPKDEIARGNYQAITQKVEESLRIISEVKKT